MRPRLPFAHGCIYLYLLDLLPLERVAEEEGFEPPDEFPRQRFSRPPP